MKTYQKIFIVWVCITLTIYAHPPKFPSIPNYNISQVHHNHQVEKHKENVLQKAETADSTLSLVGQWGYGNTYAVEIDERYAYMNSGTYFQVVDIYSKNGFSLVAEIHLPDLIYDIIIEGDLAYVGLKERGLFIIDISDPNDLKVMGSCEANFNSMNIEYHDGLIFIASYEKGVWIIDVRNPLYPEVVGSIDTPGFAKDVSFSDDFIYIADGEGGLRMIDVSDPEEPVEKAYYLDEESVNHVVSIDNYVYIATRIDMFKILEVDYSSDSMRVVKEFELDDICDMKIENNILYITKCSDGMQFLNITDRANPSGYRSYYSSLRLTDISVDGAFATVVNNTSGMIVFQLSNLNYPLIKGSYSFPYNEISNFFIADSLMYVIQGSGGIDMYDISDPSAFRNVGKIHQNESYNINVKKGNYLFSSGSSGLAKVDFRISDVSDPANPEVVYSNDSFHPVRNIVIKGNYLFVTSWSWQRGLRIFEISDPENPKQLGSFIPPENVRNVHIADGYAYLIAGNIYILDLFDYNRIIEKASIPNPGGAMDIVVIDTIAYIGNYEGNIGILDVSDAANPKHIGDVPVESVWDLEYSGNYLYYANYRKGVGVIDVSDPANPRELAFYDTPLYAFTVKYFNGFLYAGCDEAGILVFKPDFTTSIEEPTGDIPTSYTLYQNYPNPFNPVTRIRFSLPEAGFVSVSIYNILGERVATLVDEYRETGDHEVVWNAAEQPSGIYFYELSCNGFRSVKKMLFLR